MSKYCLFLIVIYYLTGGNNSMSRFCKFGKLHVTKGNVDKLLGILLTASKELYTYFVSKWVNREYRQLFTKNQFHQAMKHAKVNNLSTVTYEQVLSIFNSYLLFNGRK